MYGIFTCIYHKDQPTVGKYIIPGWYGMLDQFRYTPNAPAKKKWTNTGHHVVHVARENRPFAAIERKVHQLQAIKFSGGGF